MINLRIVSACLITKEVTYPAIILERLLKFEFGEILILTNCDSPYRKHELFAKAKYDLLYCQDDDAICPIAELANLADPEKINLATKPAHLEFYKNMKTAVGFGWGAIFPKKILASLKRYTSVYGEDHVFKRETERILMCLNFPQNRFVLPIADLPSALASDRLSMQPGHYNYIPLVEQRCSGL